MLAFLTKHMKRESTDIGGIIGSQASQETDWADDV